MSFIVNTAATCPTCGTEAEMQFPASINADRRPDLRSAILDGSLFSHACRACGEQLRFEPQLTYLDVGRRQWILAQPAEERGNWQTAEQDAGGVYDLAFGAAAPAAARGIGGNLVPRLVFGRAALVEKLLCQEMGLDDVALEAMKLAALASGAVPTLNPDLDLRLVGEREQVLLLRWIDPDLGTALAGMQIPRSAYVLAKAGEAWAQLRHELAGRMYVDIGRVMRVPAASEA